MWRQGRERVVFARRRFNPRCRGPVAHWSPGSLTTQGVTFTATGRGADIWGSADAFVYASIRQENDVTLTARVKNITGAEAWAKAGVMIREDFHRRLPAGDGSGHARQRRGDACTAPRLAAASVQAADVPGVTPAWVRLVRKRHLYGIVVGRRASTRPRSGRSTCRLPRRSSTSGCRSPVTMRPLRRRRHSTTCPWSSHCERVTAVVIFDRRPTSSRCRPVRLPLIH